MTTNSIELSPASLWPTCWPRLQTRHYSSPVALLCSALFCPHLWSNPSPRRVRSRNAQGRTAVVAILCWYRRLPDQTGSRAAARTAPPLARQSPCTPARLSRVQGGSGLRSSVPNLGLYSHRPQTPSNSKTTFVLSSGLHTSGCHEPTAFQSTKRSTSGFVKRTQRPISAHLASPADSIQA